MGHDYQDTTLGYIGTLDAQQRAPQDAYGTGWLKSMWEALSVPAVTNVTIESKQLETSSPAVDGGYVLKIVP